MQGAFPRNRDNERCSLSYPEPGRGESSRRDPCALNYTIRQLRALQAIVLTGSVTIAAERMNLTQSAVSRLLKSLEEQCGLAIFERRGNRLTATPEGRAFYREALKVLDELDNLERRTQALKLHGDTRLRIASMPRLANSILPPALARLQREVPDLSFDIILSQRSDFESWMAADEFDLGLALLPLHQPGLKAIEFSSMRLVLLVPPDWDTEFELPVPIEALRDLPLIMTSETSLLRQLVAGEFQRLGVNVRPMGQASTANTVCKLVEAGLGLGVTDPLTAMRYARHGVKILPIATDLTVQYGFLIPEDRSCPPLVPRLCDAIEAEMDLLKAEYPDVFTD